MAWSRAQGEVRAFIERTRLPFLASPMGKGSLDDNHPLSVGAARSHALKEADVIFLLGARLNWIMHYGQPRFSKTVRVVQLDISPEAIGNNVPTEVALVGDGKAVIGQLNKALERRQWFYPADTAWRSAIARTAAENAKAIQPMIDDDTAPTNYYRALKDIRAWAAPSAVIIGEGANTMDIGRTQLPNAAPASGSTRALTAPWASAWASPSPPPWCTPTGRSSRSAAIRRWDFLAWKSRPPAAIGCPSRSWC
jgi:2-hydroxyacyl-CoA lyase 1